MWRLRYTVVLTALVAAVIFGTTVAQGAWYWNAWYWNAWYWNASESAEGVDFRTAWTVEDSSIDDSIDGDELNYHANIRIRVPLDADLSLVAKADTESVTLEKAQDLECKSDGIEAEVFYSVMPLVDAKGDLVRVWVTADAQKLTEATGHLRETIKVQILIPAESPSC